MTLLSIRGLLSWDPDLFDAMQLPSALDAETVKANIIMECSELQVWLPDPDTFREALQYWSAARSEIWQHLYETTKYEYNPIWNKDGTFTEKETRDLVSGTVATSENKVAAFNASAYQNAEKNETDATGTDKGTITRERTEKGNIGITSTQQLIKEEREIAGFDIYAYITRDFKERFCLCVY